MSEINRQEVTQILQNAKDIANTAEALELSPATIKREWQFARTWLHREMTEEP